MKTLLVIDSGIKPDRFRDLFLIHKGGDFDLFQLSGTSSAIKDLAETLNSNSRNIKFLDSFALINEQVDIMRLEIPSWSYSISKAAVGGRSVKERLLLPGKGVSAWWFGLISEKNTYKTDIFLRVCQSNAIRKLLDGGAYDNCVFAVSDAGLLKSFKKACLKNKVKYHVMKSTPFYSSLFFNLFSSQLFRILSAFSYSIRLFIRGWICRLAFKQLKGARRNKNSTLFFSYFPAVDKADVSVGLFRNKYAVVLQDEIQRSGLRVSWVLMYVHMLNGYNFQESVALAKSFIKNGESLFMLEEFVTFDILLEGLYLWVWLLKESRLIFKRLDKCLLNASPFNDHNGHYLKNLWQDSFVGPKAAEGILNFLVFKKLFKVNECATRCFYLFEMQSWEKALNAASKLYPERTLRTIGFQHSVFSKNDFQYLYSREEFAEQNTLLRLPLPDKLICNGEVSLDFFGRLGYVGARKVEAARHIYLASVISGKHLQSFKKEPFLLVLCPINKTETLNLLNIVGEIFGKVPGWEIAIREHPAQPLKDIFKMNACFGRNLKHLISREDLSTSLRRAKAVLTTSGAASIEALAFDCEVIVPLFPDFMLKNPLVDFDVPCFKVISAEALISVLCKIYSGSGKVDPGKQDDFVKRYWNLDPDLTCWRKEFASEG